MISEKTLEKINQVLGEKPIRYKGPLMYGYPEDSEIDLKLKFLGYRKMISVGEYHDYLRVEVTIVGIYDDIGNLLLNPKSGKLPTSRDFWEKNRWHFLTHLGDFISKKLRYFSDDTVRVVIEEVIIDLKNTEPIKEEKMSKIAIRTLVRDITKIIKDKKEGTFYLPDQDGGEYSFTNLPFSFSCEFELMFDDTIKKTMMNAAYSYEDDVVEIFVKINPNDINKEMYDIIGELNEIIAHELEHGRQHYYNEDDKNDPPDTSFEYYSQLKEVKAQKVGFKRLSKLRKKPVDEIAKDWFKTHKEIHGLNEDETRKVLSLILN